jgi:hypothetical protein
MMKGTGYYLQLLSGIESLVAGEGKAWEKQQDSAEVE